mgnify:CR=1 FL=1
MSNDIPTQFRTALNHLLQQEGRGAQVRLARVENIDRGYLNAIIKGRKPGAEAIRSRIAAHFGMTYEEMLLLGRRLLAGDTEAAPESGGTVSRRAELEGKGKELGRTAGGRRTLAYTSPTACARRSIFSSRKQSSANPSSRSSLFTTKC